MGIHISLGSGKAHCKICGELIEKDTCSVNYSTYRHETHHHANCIKDKIQDWEKLQQMKKHMKKLEEEGQKC